MGIRWLLVGSLALGCSGAPAKPLAAAQPRPPAPDLAAVRAALADHDWHAFDKDAQARGCPADQSLGDYVAMLVMNGETGDDPKDVHRLSGGCGDFPVAEELLPVDPPADPAYWYCRVDAYASDPAGESPWHYELRLRMRRSDGAIDLATLGCPGSP